MHFAGLYSTTLPRLSLIGGMRWYYEGLVLREFRFVLREEAVARKEGVFYNGVMLNKGGFCTSSETWFITVEYVEETSTYLIQISFILTLPYLALPYVSPALLYFTLQSITPVLIPYYTQKKPVYPLLLPIKA